MATQSTPHDCTVYASNLLAEDKNLYDLHTLTGNIVVTLPPSDEAHVALRHIHTIDMHNHNITVVIPARLFNSAAFLPYLARHTHAVVDEAKALLTFTSGHPVPGHQKYHVVTMISNQRKSILPPTRKCAASSKTKPAEFVDLVCTMPTRVHGHFTKALIDTASNHSMITLSFLQRHGLSYHEQPYTTTGISSSSAPCLGSVILDTRVGRRLVAVKYTVVESLPSATVDMHEPNEVLFALDVTSAVNMSIEFKHPRIIVTVPSDKQARRRKAKTWYHIINFSNIKYTTETSKLDDFIAKPAELKSLVNKASQGKAPLYVVNVKPTMESMCASAASARKKGYLSQQHAPAPQTQDTTNIPDCIQDVIHKHKASGGTLGPAPPNTTACGFEMNIETLPGARPRAARQYRLTPHEKSELEKQIQHLLDMGWIQPSVSPWASSILFAPKPGGKLRLCVDYRYLNENTVKNTYPLPRIDTLLDQLKGHKYFSALDLASGYHQIKLSETAQPKTAFRTPDGLYQWTVMPFGLTNAPSVFQQAMHVVLKGLIGKICLAYLDDIIVLARTPEEHAANLNTVLTRLHEHQFFCNVDKCQFAMQQIKYLGHVVTAETVKPDPHKVEVLRAWPSLDVQQSANNIRSFLGLAGYFRRFIPKFPTLAAPLLERVSSKENLPWTAQCEQSFNDIKNALINATAMYHPDLSKPFHIYTDSSDYAFGAVLTQKHEDELQPVAWAGRKMSKPEVNYYTLEKELGAIIFASRQWRCYLENNQPVYIHSDHNPLRFLQTQKKLNGKQARWVESLSRINWYITYIPGDKNVVADAVSRATHLPMSQVVLHDGHTLAAEKPQEPYSALSLTSSLVRRDPAQPYGTNSFESPILMGGSGARSPGSTSAPNTAAQISPAALFYARMSEKYKSTSPNPNDPRSFPVLPPPLQRDRRPRPQAASAAAVQPPPYNTRQRTVMSTQRTPEVAMPTHRHQPQRQRKRSGRSRSPPTLPPPPPTAESSGMNATPEPESGTPLSVETDGMVVDQPVGTYVDQEVLDAVGTELSSKADTFLELDIKIDDFWERLRSGYAHDPAFKTPPAKFRFDKHFQAYFFEHKLVVPDYSHLRKQILLWHHVHPWHAHLGIKRTHALLADTFYWPNMAEDIKKFVSQCHSCQTMKTPGTTEAALSPLPVPSACWRIVSLDAITQLPRTTSGYDCIIVFVDQFSKMVRLIPTVSTLDGPGFAKLFFQHIYPHYGLPLGICSDRGVQWNNAFFKSLCAHLGIQLRLTFSYHPQANGQVERLNRVIEEALRHFVGPAHDDWDEYIPHVEFSINNSKCESTGCTPFQLNRITPPLSPTALAFGLPTGKRLAPGILHRMYYHLAKQALSLSKQSMWSTNVHPDYKSKFDVGNQVLLSVSKIALHHPSLRRKFTARWVGPCSILELVGSSAARIQLPSTLQQLRLHDVFHFSALKPYVSADFNEFSNNPHERPASDLNGVFEVESILDYKRSHSSSDDPLDKGPHYLVHWKGYSPQHDVWLPVRALSNCLDKVADYLFQNASSRQRDVMIDQFPRQERMQLAHLLARAQRTSTRPSHTGSVMHKPPKLASRQRKSTQATTGAKHTAALSTITPCTCCGRPLT